MEHMLKRLIQDKLHERQENKYEQELKLQKDSYAAFLRIYEGGSEGETLWAGGPPEAAGGAPDGGIWMRPYGNTLILCQECMTTEFLTGRADGCGFQEEYLLFAGKKGGVAVSRLPVMEAYFREHPVTQAVYFHTDEVDRNGKRGNPLFLPEWSPDTLASSFYFGECFAVRSGAFQKAVRDLMLSGMTAAQTGRGAQAHEVREILYAAVLLLTAQEPAALLDMVMYHKLIDARDREELRETEFEDGLLLDRILRRLSGAGDIHGVSPDGSGLQAGCFLPGRWAAYAARRDVCREAHMVSILIPSRDHPEILRRCVESVRRHDCRETDCKIRYEIIVIDNGSKTENRSLYEAYAGELGYRYEYRPMEFNFSRMCNMAAELAGGEYYLFLNDDMEALSGDWLAKLLELAALSHVGAVGAKLLYPGSTLIQHAGITNMYEGPAHKLLKYDDRAIYYGGRNRGVWDVIGVTAACLMVSKEKFDRAGGFAEELRVAYNDVDLCFRLHQKGWFNVVRNDLSLYHHESLSRGNDHLDPAKRERLAAERKTLYRRSPGYYDYDPFYSRHLTGASEAYECTLPYENRNIRPVGGVKKLSGGSGERLCADRNETLIIQVDTADREPLSRQGEKPAYLIDLHAHVRGLDSCDYRYRMLLKGRKGCYEIPATRRLRPDVEKTIANEKHVELSGFVARIPGNMLPPDDYEIWMEAKCSYSRQRLCNRAERTLAVTE